MSGETKTGFNQKKEKKSSYSQIFYTGDNEEQANIIGNHMTYIHSIKIKSGNELENLVVKDFENHCIKPQKMYKKGEITIKTKEDLENLPFPCIINSCRFSKQWYENNNQICKNKKLVEIDFNISYIVNFTF